MILQNEEGVAGEVGDWIRIREEWKYSKPSYFEWHVIIGYEYYGSGDDRQVVYVVLGPDFPPHDPGWFLSNFEHWEFRSVRQLAI